MMNGRDIFFLSINGKTVTNILPLGLASMPAEVHQRLIFGDLYCKMAGVLVTTFSCIT